MYAKIKSNKFYLLTGLLVLAGWLWVLWSYLAVDSGISVCVFNTVTGYPCPACGSTGSLQLIVGGEWMAALMVNPFGYLMGAGLVILPFWLFFDLVSGIKSFQKTVLLFDEQIKKNRFLLLLVLLPILLNWIWNIVKAGAQ